jgi:ferredoxin--NADP+ reductase
MMKVSSDASRAAGVETVVSLTPLMVDGTGMCGACRVEVDGKTKFACVDGPDFDGHQVDWNIAFDRQKLYLKEEKESLEKWESCQCGKS